MAKITRSIDQIIFRHAPMSFIALEDSNMFGIITEIGGKQDTNVDKSILFKKVKQYVKKWEEDSEDRVLGYSSEEINEETIIAIKPEENIKWDFLPNSLFQCSNESCNVVVNSSDQFFKGRCHVCSSKLKQFRYVWYHPCGVVRAFEPIPDTFCRNGHGKEFLYLHDTGRFRSSTWRCLKCQHESSLRMLPCPNVICRKKSEDKRDFFLQGAVWSDPWVYFSQVATFVNLKDDQIKPILNSDIKDQLLISAYLGTIEAGQGRLKNKASENNSNIICAECGASIPNNSKFCIECGEKVVAISKELKIDIGNNISLNPLSDDSDLAIFAAVRDLEMTRSFKDEKNKHKITKNVEKAMTSELIMSSLNKIGIDDIYLIGDFPLTHIAYGYTRFQSKPPSWLRAFPPISQNDTKVPVYTNCVTTEAWMIQLSAKYLLEWLIENKTLDTNDINVANLTESDAKLWLLELLNKESEDENEIRIQTIINELIHSLSHTLLYSLAIESGLDIASFGEILLHNALSFIVYGGESDVGGLSASFQQGLGSLLDSIKDDLRSCKFDPSCSEDDDGACVGCLYIPRGCVEFNEKLSRSYVFGGKTKHSTLTDIPYGYLDYKSR